MLLKQSLKNHAIYFPGTISLKINSLVQDYYYSKLQNFGKCIKIVHFIKAELDPEKKLSIKPELKKKLI